MFKNKASKHLRKIQQGTLPYKYKNVTDQLSRNKQSWILEQDKERGIVLIDRTESSTRCLELLQMNQFIRLYHDPTKLIESKIERILRKFKNRLSSKEYYQLYPTG